jgi:hypothetical protein
MSCLHYLQDHGYKVLKLLASCRLIYPGTFLWDCEFNIIREYTNFRGFLKPYEITKFRIQRICVTIYFEFRTVSWSWSYVVGFTTICVISAYHQWSWEFESLWWRSVLDTTLCDQVCQLLAVGLLVFPGYSGFHHQ